MATAVIDLEATELPERITLSDRHRRALILIRWKGVPVGQTELPAPSGTISGDRLADAVIQSAGEVIGHHQMLEYLGLDPLPGPRGSGPATIAVCTRDRPDDLDRCLTAVVGLVDQGGEILVIDSASRGDATRDVVGRHPGVRWIREEQPGLDRARNRALVEARHEIVAFTDDDAVPDRRWLQSLVAGFRHPRILCVTGLTLPLELETEAQEWFERTNSFSRGFRPVLFDGAVQDPFFASRVGAGVNMALRRSVLDLVGRFDEALDAGTPTRSGGDHDIFTRIMARGYCIAYQPRALSWHRHRREWAELRNAVYGYGVGVYAYLTALFLAGETRAVVVAARWFPWQLRLMLRGLFGRRGGVPPRIALAELRGCLNGPFAYLESRRRNGPPR
jgi:glycosyltransferase involved in cell wall biosynthesis